MSGENVIIEIGCFINGNLLLETEMNEERDYMGEIDAAINSRNSDAMESLLWDYRRMEQNDLLYLLKNFQRYSQNPPQESEIYKTITKQMESLFGLEMRVVYAHTS